jgi:hypothetical protein
LGDEKKPKPKPRRIKLITIKVKVVFSFKKLVEKAQGPSTSFPLRQRFSAQFDLKVCH